MGEKNYMVMLDIDTRKRHYHLAEAGKITKFMVQLEVKVENTWKEVVRFDCAHGYAHKDCYDIKGKCRKINLSMSFEDALTFADDDVNENWEIYRHRFLKGDMS
jgi:hypothetical protein